MTPAPSDPIVEDVTEYRPDSKGRERPILVSYIRLEFLERCGNCGHRIRWFLWRPLKQRGRKPTRKRFSICGDCTAGTFRRRSRHPGNGRLRVH